MRVFIGLLFSFFDFLVPKRDNLIVFAGQRGIRYFDNSRYLYEYYLEHVNSAEVYWLCLNKEGLPSRGETFIYTYSLKGLWLALRARVAFASYGCADFGLLRFSRYKIFIQLWHGAPLKTIFLGQRKLRFWIKLKNMYELSRFSYFLVSSPFERLAVAQQTGLPLDRVIVLGYPRNDVLKSPSEDLVKKTNQIRASYSSVILFAPTFREGGQSPFSAISEATWGKLCAYLEEKNCLLIIRAHATEFLFNKNGTALSLTQKYPNVQFAASDVYPDVQLLMLASDILISDYSGIIFDYLLLARPIIRYVYDEEEYDRERGVLYLAQDIELGTTVRSEHDLIHAIDESLTAAANQIKYKVLRNFFHSGPEKSSCGVIVEFVEKQVHSI